MKAQLIQLELLQEMDRICKKCGIRYNIIAGTLLGATAPWWKPQEIEARYENPQQNEKFFYKFLGDGLRYEISNFAAAANGNVKIEYKLKAEDSVALAGI